MGNAIVDVEKLLYEIEELKRENLKLKKELKNKRYGLVWKNIEEGFEKESEGKIPVLKQLQELNINSYNNKQHILIEGDNYHALTCLNYTHREMIDVIYIDPPYNTGNDDFRYKDKRILDKFPDGTTVPKNHPFRHSYWLSFMSKRLELAKELLSKNGVIFISIDDNEYAQLKLLCDEIFLEENYVTTIHVQMSTVSGQKVKAAKKGCLVKNGEFILVYCNSGTNQIGKNLLYDPVKYDTHYSIFLTPIDENIWTESSLVEECVSNDEIFQLLLNSGLAYVKNDKRIFTIKNLEKAYKNLEEFRNFIHINADRIVRTDRMIGVDIGKLEKDIHKKTTYTYVHNTGKKYLYGIDSNGNLKQRFLLSDKIRVCDDYYKTNGVSNIRGDWWEGFHYDMGNVSREGGVKFENGKKPVRLIKQLIKYVSNKNAIILDFFAGSGTTAHAVMELNSEDGGSRQAILVTNNEKNICKDVCYKRLKNIIESQAYSNNSLRYFKTEFVGEHNIAHITDDDKVSLAMNVGGLVSLAENTFDIVKETSYYQIFKNNYKFTAIYFREDLSKFSEFKEELSKLDNEIVAYMFSWGIDEFNDDFKEFDKLTLKNIPLPILKIYKTIFNL